MRLFVALELSETVKSALIAAQRELKQLLPSGCVRWTRPDALHLTLRFLGNVPEEKLEELKAALARATRDQRALELTCEGLGCFPNLQFPRVLWAEVHDAPGNVSQSIGVPVLRGGALDHLHSAVGAACDPFADKADDLRFIGHVTFGRFRRLGRHDAQLVARVIEGYAHDEIGNWTVGEVVLFRSELRPDGARHVPIERFPLERT